MVLPMLCPALQAAQLDEPVLRAYLRYLQRGLFSSFSPPSGMETAHQLFLRLALLDGEAGGGGGSTAQGGRGGTSGGGTGGGSGVGAAGSSAPLQGAAGGSTQLAAASGEAALGGAAQAAGPEAQQPPLNSSYHVYASAGVQGRGAQGRLFHAEYALVLAACSPLVWLQPEALHEVRWSAVQCNGVAWHHMAGCV